MFIVTGGAGFIGSNLVAKLNAEGITDILIVDELGSGEKWRNIQSRSFIEYLHKEEFLELIESGRSFLPNNQNKIEAIVHLGASSATTVSDMDFLINNNYRYTRTLAQYALKNDIRFVYASSAATYGHGEQGYAENYQLLSKLKPLNPYGYSKQLFDLWALRNDYLRHLVGLKFFNVYGPNEYHKHGQLSGPLWAYRQIQESGVVKLFRSNDPAFADGDQARDFVYVKDCCDLIWWLLAESQVNGILNVGTGIARSWNDMARATFAAVGRTPQIEYMDLPENLCQQYQNHTQADISKLQNIGCPVTFRTLEEGVADYVTQYLERSDPYL